MGLEDVQQPTGAWLPDHASAPPFPADGADESGLVLPVSDLLPRGAGWEHL